ncbi:hypothetical protein V7S43_014510 [Phytophthora oleae]|uniref:BZIP domain-containing protein n=1 Tax=Phytophthora oleae TaxID=2107226 RepID=A0ABD3F3X0_9STRA
MTLVEAVTTLEAGSAGAPCQGISRTKIAPRRRRKATGTRRKEEIEALEQEVTALQAQIAAMQKDAQKEITAKRSELQQDILETDFIRQTVLQQQASLVNVQSALSRLTMTQPGAPHAASIRLGMDLKERWAMLMEMKPIKLQAAQFI